MTTTSRKLDHIRISLENDVSFGRRITGLEQWSFVHQALPEIDLAEVNPTVTFLNHRLAFPLIIASMTGGTPEAGLINQHLAEAAQTLGIGMGVGSMRAALESPDLAWTFQVRQYAPDILLLANLGAVQLNYGYGVDECRRVVELIEADALILHLNPLQEALQPEGDTNFSGLLRRIEAVCSSLEVPVIAKEVGWGFSRRAARQLVDAGVAALDVAGAGGTSWSQVEMFRSTDSVQREVAAAFREWGIPTAAAVLNVRAVAPQIPLIASGGVRTGIDIAKSLALGADVASMATPLLRAVMESPAALVELLQVLKRQVQVAMFAVGARDVASLRHAELERVQERISSEELK